MTSSKLLKSTAPGQQKFRPYFTYSEMLETIAALRGKNSPASLGIANYLETFIFKLRNNLVAPAITNKQSVADALELGDDTGAPRNMDFKRAAFDKYMDDPRKCSNLELENAQLYRYENDLMTVEEEIEYEQKAFSLTKG